MTEEDNFFCEFDTENDIDENEDEHDEQGLDPITPPVEREDVVYRLRRMLTEVDDESQTLI